MSMGTDSAGRWAPFQRIKESGVPWLGFIPEHWNMGKLKHLVRFVGGGTPARDNLDYWNGSIPWVSPKDMKRWRIEDAEDRISPEALHESATQLVPAGSVLLVVRSGILRHTIPVALADRSVALNQDMKALLVGPGLVPEYLAYQIAGLQDALLLQWKKSGATVESLEMDLLGSTPIVVPPIGEQEAIAAFLDRETAKIAALLAEKRSLISLLDELRKALVHRAVTKGLSPGAPLRDSRIDWMGGVPACWGVSRVKHVARLASGHTPSRQEPAYWIDCKIPWFTLADVWQIRDDLCEQVSETQECISELGLANSAACLLPAGTVMLSRTASVGFSAIMARPMATTQDFANWVCGPALMPEYLVYVFRAMRQEFSRLMMGSTHQTIYMPDMGRLVTPVPPMAEQVAIVAFIRRESERLDALVARVRAAVTRLIELRTALISAAVTGKIDVRQEAS